MTFVTLIDRLHQLGKSLESIDQTNLLARCYGVVISLPCFQTKLLYRCVPNRPVSVNLFSYLIH